MAPRDQGTTTKKAARKTQNKGGWTADEDMRLSEYIELLGPKRWKTIALKAGLNRCGKSCRLRWLNYLRPNIKRGNISDDEEDLILRLHKLLGNREINGVADRLTFLGHTTTTINPDTDLELSVIIRKDALGWTTDRLLCYPETPSKWSLIAGRLPGRTDNEIKNYWNSHLSKKLNCHKDKKVESGLSPALESTLQSPPPNLPQTSESNAINPSSSCTGISFDLDNFFDFSAEGTCGLEWVSEFLESSDEHFVEGF